MELFDGAYKIPIKVEAFSRSIAPKVKLIRGPEAKEVDYYYKKRNVTEQHLAESY